MTTKVYRIERVALQNPQGAQLRDVLGPCNSYDVTMLMGLLSKVVWVGTMVSDFFRLDEGSKSYTREN